MGKIKFSLCFKKKQAKKLILAPKIAPRVERSDPARNSYFAADFLSARLECSQFLHNWGNFEPLYGRGGGAWNRYSTDDRSELQHDSLPWQNRI